MITKTQAQATVVAFQNSILHRLNAFLTAQAKSGIVGGQFHYGTQEDNTKLQEARTILQAAGWTVVVDAPNRTATIS